MLKKRNLTIFLILIFTVISMVSCGSGAKYTLISDDADNIRLLESSTIGRMLRDRVQTPDYSQINLDEPIPDSPWLIVRQSIEGEKLKYIPVATSEKEFDENTIKDIKVLGIYIGQVNSANYYNSVGGSATVSTESGYILYFDVKTGKMIGYDRILPKELPEQTTGNRDYDIDDVKIAETVALRIQSQIGSRYSPDEFMEKGDGILTGVDFEKIYQHRNDENILYIPEKFTKIDKDAFAIKTDNYNSKWSFDYFNIPDTVTEIDENAWSGYHNGLVLIVGHDSVAEKFAKENLIMYAYREDPIIVYVPDGTICWYMPLTFIEVEKYCFTNSVKSVSDATAQRFVNNNYKFKIEAPKGSFMAKFVKKNSPKMLIEN